MASQPQRRRRSWLLIFLLIPFVALLYPPFYNSPNPTFIGIPFLYWYSMLWIILTAILTAVLYFLGV
jgi:polyferredoxin